MTRPRDAGKGGEHNVYPQGFVEYYEEASWDGKRGSLLSGHEASWSTWTRPRGLVNEERVLRGHEASWKNMTRPRDLVSQLPLVFSLKQLNPIFFPTSLSITKPLYLHCRHTPLTSNTTIKTPPSSPKLHQTNTHITPFNILQPHTTINLNHYTSIPKLTNFHTQIPNNPPTQL